MNLKIDSLRFRGSILAPSSPSYAVKAITAAALADTATHIKINSVTASVKSAINAVRSLGAMVWETGEGLELHPSRRGLHGSILYGYGEFVGEVTSPLIEVLNSHGSRVSRDKPPFITEGRLKPGRYVLEKGADGYAVSGLLISLPLIGEECEIVVSDRLPNREYVTETIKILSKFGIEILEEGNKFIIPPKSKYTSPSEINVFGDFETAAPWFAAKKMGCRVEITGLGEGKKEILQIFDSIMHSDVVNASRFPHLAPLFAACAAQNIIFSQRH